MGSFIPLRYEFRTVVGRPEGGLQFGIGFIIEAEISGDEPFFEDSRTGKHSHRGPLRPVGGHQQHFSVSLEESSGDSSSHVLSESDGAIVKSDVECRPIEGSFPDAVNPRLVQTDATQLKVESLSRDALRSRLRCCWAGFGIRSNLRPAWRHSTYHQGQAHRCRREFPNSSDYHCHLR